MMDEHVIDNRDEQHPIEEPNVSEASRNREPKDYQPIIRSLKHSLWKHESYIGRYTSGTAQCYCRIGDILLQIQEVPRAIVMHKASYRINIFLYGECFGQIGGTLRDLLEQRGLSPNGIRSDIFESMKFEMEGDLLRRFGDLRGALREYRKAARVEEFAFGRDNPDLAYLCRKMACLAAIRPDGGSRSIHPQLILDFDEADKMGQNNKWLKNAKEELNPSVCLDILKGDKYYEQGDKYYQAVREYRRATTVVEYNPQHKSRSGRNKNHSMSKSPKSVSSKRRKQTTEDMVQEIRSLLSGTLPSKSVNNKPDSDSANAALKTKNEIESGDRHRSQREQHRHDDDMLSPASRKSRRGRSSSSKESGSRHRRHHYHKKATGLNIVMDHHKPESVDTTGLRQPSAVSANVDDAKLDKNSATAMGESTQPALSVPKTPKSMPRSILPPPSAIKQTSPSSSYIVRKHKRPMSESSILKTVMRPPSYMAEKPKSDSYITKIAQKTTKIAKNRLKSQLRRSRSNSSKDKSDKSSKGSSLFGSLRKDRTVETKVEERFAAGLLTTARKIPVAYFFRP